MLEIRTAARLLVLDPNSRLLLFLHADGHGREFWATPGGGVQPGETMEAAALREAAEELGIHDLEISELWTGQSEFDFADRRVLQTETFFLVAHRAEILGPEVHETHQLERIHEVRWWTLQEIDEYRGPLFPVDLAERVRRHLPIR